MHFHFLNISFTTERFITLILAILIIFVLMNEAVKILQKGIKSRKAANTVTKLVFMLFLAVACFFLLKYSFGW